MGAALEELSAECIVGRYAIYDRIAAGGMAVVHMGRLLGQAGFARTVAIKRLHAQFARDPSFVAMFLDEARLTARIQHPNVVAPLDVVVLEDELIVVMEYVSGETLAHLVRIAVSQGEAVPVPIVAQVMCGTLYGLHAAHEAVSEAGAPLQIVHRDVSPQNIMVGVDGLARVLDFGVAKATMRSQATKDGEVKGKLSYMAPEQISGKEVDCRADVFAAGVVLWEALAGQRLFRGQDLAETIHKLLSAEIPPPSRHNPEVPAELDLVVARALCREPTLRFQSAREFASAIEGCVATATPSVTGDWVRRLGGTKLADRMRRVAAIESSSSRHSPVNGPIIAERAARRHSGVELRVADEGPSDATVRWNVASASAVQRSPDAAAESASQSAVLVSRPVAARARARVVLGVLGACAAALGAWALLAPAAAPAPSIAESRATAAQERTTAPSVEPVSTARAVEAEPAAAVAPVPVTVATAPTPRATASTPRATPSTAAGTSGSAKAKRASAKPVPAAKPKSCNPPYYLDEKGIRRIKAGCI